MSNDDMPLLDQDVAISNEGGSDENVDEIKKRTQKLRMTMNGAVEDGGVVTLNGVEVNLDRADETASNGVIHFIDQVIYPIPSGSIIDTLREDERLDNSLFMER